MNYSSELANARTVMPPSTQNRMLVGELQGILESLMGIHGSQANTLDCLVGPRPENAAKEVEPKAGSIDELIQRIAVMIDRIAAQGSMIQQRIGG